MSSAGPFPVPDQDQPWHRRLLRGEVGRIHPYRAALDATPDITPDPFEAETQRRIAELERDRAEELRRAEAAKRAVAETTAFKIIQERNEALARVAELEARLAEPEPEPEPEPDPEPEPESEAAAPEAEVAATAVEPAVEPAETPASAPPAAAEPVENPAPAPAPVVHPDPVSFSYGGSSPALTLLLGLGALTAAGVAVYEAYLDRLTSGPGLLASAVTLVLVMAVSRGKDASHRLWVDQGVLHVDDGEGRQRFDLTSSDTKVEMIGRPGERRWKVLVIRRGKAPLEVDRRMVDPARFLEVVRAYRPGLGRG